MLITCGGRRERLYTHNVVVTPSHPVSELSLEVVEDEVREGFRHGSHLRDVVSHDCVGEGEGGSGAIGQVTHHQAI